MRTALKRTGMVLAGAAAVAHHDLRTVAENIEAANIDTQDYTQVTFGSGTPSPGTSLTSGQTVGTDTVYLSAGNTVTWVGGNASSYCLSATNSHSGTATWYYDSSASGLTQVPCTADNP